MTSFEQGPSIPTEPTEIYAPDHTAQRIHASMDNRNIDDRNALLHYRTKTLVELLAKPHEADGLVRLWDEGGTYLRDISGLTEYRRTRLLTIAQEGTDAATEEDLMFADQAAQFFSQRMSLEADDSVVKSAGWDFLIELESYCEARQPWALRFDATLKQKFGEGASNMTARFASMPAEKSQAHQLFVELGKDERYGVELAVYLAARSLESQKKQESLYGAELSQAKMRAATQLNRLAPEMGLDREYHERALAQIYRTQFGSFDPLVNSLYASEYGRVADYVGGTLRVQVYYEGTAAEPVRQTHYTTAIQHEITHAGSVQNRQGTKVGLAHGAENGSILGYDLNEALTQFLEQEARNFPDITYLDSGLTRIRSMPYHRQTSAMAYIFKQQPEVFATLYRAYYGQINDQNVLVSAIDTYDKLVARFDRFYSSSR